MYDLDRSICRFWDECVLVLGVSTLTRWERLSHRILEVNEHFKPFLSHVRINGQPTIWPRPLLRHATSASTRGAWRPRGKAPLVRPVGGHSSCKVTARRLLPKLTVRDRGWQTAIDLAQRILEDEKSGYTDPRFRDSDKPSEEEEKKKKRN
jgi:hypothetical protein